MASSCASEFPTGRNQAKITSRSISSNKKCKNPDNLKELSDRALEFGTELSTILEILDDIMEDE
jgi:hypothetical protein